MKNRQLGVLAILAVIVVAWLVFASARSNRTEPSRADVKIAPQSTVRESRADLLASAPYRNIQGQAQNDPVTDQLMSQYLDWSQYPPNSRPLEADSTHIEAAQVRRHERRLVNQEDGVFALAAPDRVTYRVGDTMRVSLQVEEENTNPVAALDAKVELSTGQTASFIEKEEGRFEAQLVLANGESEGRGERAKVTFSYAQNGQMRVAQVHFAFALLEEWPAQWTSQLEDHVREGQLFVDAEIDVHEAGLYALEALLFDEGELPIARSKVRRELETGRHVVSFHFFGRILARHAGASRYVLRTLRGRLEPADDPGYKEIPECTPRFVTRSYGSAEFDSSEWESKAKDRRTRMLGRLNSWVSSR